MQDPSVVQSMYIYKSAGTGGEGNIKIKYIIVKPSWAPTLLLINQMWVDAEVM